MKRWLAAAVCAALIVPTGAVAAKSLSHSAYSAMLKQADAQVTRAESPVEKSLQSKSGSSAELKRLMLHWAATETTLGRRFAAVTPPEVSARKANRDLSRGELDLGAETRAIALQLPTTKAAALAYVQRHNPKGGAELDKALAELRAAGYATGD